MLAACACCCTATVTLALLLDVLPSATALLTESLAAIEAAVVVALKVACTVQVALVPFGREPTIHTNGFAGTPVKQEALFNFSCEENPAVSCTDVAVDGP